MISAQVARELAGNTRGRFRLGLGSQIRTHVTRRYGSVFDKPAPQLKDYILAVRACLAAFQGDEPLNYEGRYYQLTFLNQDWTPPMHEFGRDIKIDISAVGPFMCRVAGEVADGVHVHPMHSMDYVHRHLLPKVGEGLHKAGRSMDDVDLIFPVLAAPGNLSKYVALARRQIAFYGSTPNYGFQFEDLGFDGLSQALRERLKAGDIDGARWSKTTCSSTLPWSPNGMIWRTSLSPGTGARFSNRDVFRTTVFAGRPTKRGAMARSSPSRAGRVRRYLAHAKRRRAG